MQGKVQRYGRNGTVAGAILAIPLLILGACGGPSGQGGPGGPPEQVIPVEVQPVVRTNIEEAVELIGTVRSRNRVQLASEIPGTVLKYERLDGETFQMGDVLVRLDDRDFAIRVDAAKADLAQAEQQLKELTRGTRKEIVDQYRAAVEQQKARLKDSELNLERTQTLFEKAVRTQSQLDEARYARDQAAAALAEAEARLQQAINGPTAEEIAAAKAAVAARQADLAQAQRNLEKTHIVAPFDGSVIQRLSADGAYVGPGTPLLDVLALGEMDIYFDAPENLAGRMEAGRSVHILCDALPDLSLTLPIAAIMPAAEEQSRNIPVRCVLQPGTALKPGMMVRGRMVIGRREAVLAVPQDALVNSNGGFSVYVAREGTAQPVTVKVGLRTESLVEVNGELAEGDLVVVLGNEVLSPGAKIAVAGQASGPGGQPGPPGASAGEN